MHKRMLVVAVRLLDPERNPEVDMIWRSVLVHTDLMPRNILVSVNGVGMGKGKGKRCKEQNG